MTIGALVVLLVAGLIAAHRSARLRPPLAPNLTAPPAGELFAYQPAHEKQFVARAVAGEAHALFSASPGGVPATAGRVAALRPLVATATAGTGIDPKLLEGLVFVESAGRPDAMAGPGPQAAAGLTQILPDTATMLGLNVDLAQSQGLTRAIRRAQHDDAPAGMVAALQRRRASVDQRFDPGKALAATVRYLQMARAHFGRQDLALVSYHMGMGNLDDVLAAYDGGQAVPYAQLYFDTAPDHHRAAYALLSSFNDQSWLYYWRVLGAAGLMRLYRDDRPALVRLTRLQGQDDSTAAFLHPPDQTAQFSDPDAVEAAYADGKLRPLPANAAQLGLADSPSIGALAPRLHAPAALYRGLRPAALTLLLELAGRVRTLAHEPTALQVTSAVSDTRYERLLGIADPLAATGWSFTIARPHGDGPQQQALTTVLERLQALNLVAWRPYPSEIEVTVAGDAAGVIAHGV